VRVGVTTLLVILLSLNITSESLSADVSKTQTPAITAPIQMPMPTSKIICVGTQYADGSFDLRVTDDPNTTKCRIKIKEAPVENCTIHQFSDGSTQLEGDCPDFKDPAPVK
jgi:hypothetical protein